MQQASGPGRHGGQRSRRRACSKGPGRPSRKRRRRARVVSPPPRRRALSLDSSTARPRVLEALSKSPDMSEGVTPLFVGRTGLIRPKSVSLARGQPKIWLYRALSKKPTPGFEPGSPSLRVNRICPRESPVGLCRHEVSVSSTLEGTRLDNRMRPIYGPRTTTFRAAL